MNVSNGIMSHVCELNNVVVVFWPQPCVLETCAFVMKIIGLEIYYVVR